MQTHTTAPETSSHAQTLQDTPADANLQATAPGQIRVVKRNGKQVGFDASKIKVAMTKAFLAVEGGHAAASSRIHQQVDDFAQQIFTTLQRRNPGGGAIYIEDIQDQVELTLMRAGEHKVARAYVLYRDARAKERAESHAVLQHPLDDLPEIQVKNAQGDLTPLDTDRLKTLVSEACAGLEHVDGVKLLTETMKNLYDGIDQVEVNTALVITARTLIEQEPNYSYAAARLLADQLRQEGLSYLGLADMATAEQMQSLYPQALSAYIAQGIKLELLDPQLAKYDLERLGQALNAERDLQFTYLGLQTLYDRYFIHTAEGVRFELPQVFFMRVAMGLALDEDDPHARAIEFYDLLSSFDYMSSTPTLFNSGTLRPQLSSCYLTTVPDDLNGIYGAVRDNALLSKWAGGLGNDWTQVRALGAHIKGTNGKSQGVVPFLKVANDTAVAVNQGGKRKGAVCAYLETWHLDIEEFLELRKNTGDDRRRTHDMNTANWVPDLFMKRVCEDQSWTLFSPSDVPDLHDLYGDAFEERYLAYEAMTERGELTLYKRIRALDLWRKMLSMLFETGHPWITFKDPCNLRSPQQHVGVVHSSNLCTEITLNTSEDEIAVCNLGSINLLQHTTEQGLDKDKLSKTVKTAVRMLDNVIDINYYAVPQARRSNLRHRPIGLGLMGFQDSLYRQGIPYSSEQAVNFADEAMELISYHAIEASCQLAQERGAYSSFEGSLWSKGILPIDSCNLLKDSRGAQYIDINLQQQQDWDSLRQRVKAQGMRNSNVMAIAPTATISNICGVSQSIEPTYQNLYVKSNLSGEFTVVNPHLVRALKQRDLWDEVMVNDLKYFDGSVQQIDRIPDDIKSLFATAFEVEPRWLIESASRRQKWIDQAQSLNLYINQPSGKKLDVIYRMAWYLGLKTTYYLRSMGATSTEKSTVQAGALNAVQATTAPAEPSVKACAIDDPECEACQ